ncbi:MAG: undecaprenyl-phosphate glucose phosphotransferase [Gammaproteobacteria bacterium]|nr:undecaprenyl-phosphate glucose phosphotransferase [Gammaproteobacteria bacterium]
MLSIGVLTYTLYPGWSTERYPMHLSAIAINGLVTAGVFYLRDLYKMDSIIHPQKQYSKIVLYCATIFMVLVSCGFALKISNLFSRIWIVCWFFSTIFSICLSRALIQRVLLSWVRTTRFTRDVAIVGAGKQGAQLVELMNKQKDSWFRIVGIYDDRSIRVPPELGGHPLSGSVDDLVANARANRIDDILVALPWGAEQRVFSVLEKLRVLPVDVRLIPNLVGLKLSGHDYSYYCGIPALNVFDKPISRWDYVLKTVEDKVLSALILILILPVMLIIAVLIKLESRGPVFFRQKRYGFNNQLIEVYKFRTMYVDQQDDNAQRLTTKDDPRVTTIGRFLRRTSLDELPQFFNVLKGEMSIVGPRPHAIEAKAGGLLYEKVVNQYVLRHKVKPGITGWAQVNGWRGETDTEEKIRKRVEYDIAYINSWSLARDLKIIVKTILVVLVAKNAF